MSETRLSTPFNKTWYAPALRNEKHKANRASVTEEQRRERVRIRCEKDRAKRNYKRKKKRSSVTEDNENQHQATLKRLKRGDENELERNAPYPCTASMYLCIARRWSLANSSSLPWRRK